MAKKRFTDIEIWDKEWYMELSTKHKCLMKYIFDKCDASGCWKPNWKLASIQINDNVTQGDLKSIPKEQYELLPNGKIFIPDFINFQYGSISEKSPAHNPVFIAIEKNNLSDRVFNRVSNTPKDKEKEKDKEEEVDKEKITVFLKKFNKTDFNGLPDVKIGSVIQLFKFTKQTDVTQEIVNGLWEIFKEQNLTGKKDYRDEDDVYSHFINWCKTQKIEKHGKQSDNFSDKSVGSASRKKIEALRNY